MSGDALRALSCSNCGAPLHAESAHGHEVIKCEYCGRSHVFARPPKPTARMRSRYAAGSSVRVKWGGQWWAGRIEREVGPGAWEISYDGWGKSWNETVGPDRLAPAAGSAEEAEDGDAVSPSGPPSTSAAQQNAGSRFRVGQPVRVLWKNKWWDGRVVRVISHDAWEISYDGYSTSWNEVVGPDRIAERGAAVAVNRGGGPTVAVVIAAVALVMVAGGSAAFFMARGNDRRRASGEYSGGSTSSYASGSATSSPGGATEGGDIPLGAIRPGMAIQIFWNSAWYNGRVVALVPGGGIRVHYDGYGSSWDESVPLSRIRYPR